MVLEMKRALEDLKSGDSQGYRKIFDATYEEIYCRSLLILQKEEAAVRFMRDFYGKLFGALDEADETADHEKWLWQKYYQTIRKQYNRLLAEQKKDAKPAGNVRTLAEIPSALPLLHRIMLTMYYKDDFAVSEISGIFGLEEGKIRGELDKLEKLLPTLAKGQPESVAGYLGSWKVLLLGASRQILSTGSDEWVDGLYAEVAADTGIAAEPALKKKDDFEYFVAEVELPEEKTETPSDAASEDRQEDEDADEDEDDEDEEDEDDEDDRYDWDLEDDGRKWVILGVVLALVIVAVVGFAAVKLLGSKDGGTDQTVQAEEESEEQGDAELIIKGDGPEEESEEPEESSEEIPEEESEEPEEVSEEEPAEPETVTMKVTASSSRIRSEANTDSSVVASVTQGEKVEVLSDPSEEWVQVRCIEQNQEEGYMMSQYLTAAE